MNVVTSMRLVGLYSTARAILDTHITPLSWFARLINLDRYLLDPNWRDHTPLYHCRGSVRWPRKILGCLRGRSNLA